MGSMRHPRAIRATLGNVATAFSESADRYKNSTEKVVMVTWGPFLLVLPGERRAWQSSKVHSDR